MAPIKFVMSVRPPVHIYARVFHWTDLREILFWGLYENLSGGGSRFG
jgi:hypothetical protein